MLVADVPDLPPPSPLEMSLTTESVAVNGGGRMGLVGLGLERVFHDHWRAGATVFGASRGDRGGFFAWGVSGAWQEHWGPWQAEAGLFLGGGGGSPGWVGGGWMVRPHLELARAWSDWRLGLGWSEVWFPNGQVHSRQPHLALRWRGESLLAGADRIGQPLDGRAEDGLQARQVALEAIGGAYSLRRSARRDGQGVPARLQYGGLSHRQTWGAGSDGQAYLLLSTLGAMGGGHDGYAELTGGVGWQQPLAPGWQWRAELATGSAGAGATVDTGGGWVWKWGTALGWQLATDWQLSLQTGAIGSRGPFDAREWRLALGWQGREWGPGPAGAAPLSSEPVVARWAGWRVSSGVQHQLRMQRDSGASLPMQTLSLGLARELDPEWRWVVEAATGVGGGAGGYATGRWGLGWQSSPHGSTAWRWGGEASLGAAGGGGVVVSGGLFGQAQAQWQVPVSSDWVIQADAGWLRSARGQLSSPFLGLALVSRFARAQAR